MIIEEVNNVRDAKPKVTISDPDKFKHDFVVHKSNDGFVFYQVSVTKGKVPKQLSGLYSRMENAVKDVVEYINHASPSATVIRDKKADLRDASKPTGTSD